VVPDAIADFPSQSSNGIGKPLASSSPQRKPTSSSASKPSNHTAKPSSSRNNKKKTSVRVMITNCGGVHSKKDAFAETVKESNPHLILVTESWLKPDIGNNEFIPENYTVHRKDRIGRSRGGVFIAVRNDLIATHLEFLDVDTELIWISLQMANARPIHVCCFYRPPDKGVLPIQKLRESLDKLDWKKNPTVWIGGDFNVPDVDWKVPCRKPSYQCNYPAELTTELLALLDDFSFTQLAHEPNHNHQTKTTSVRNILNLLCVTNPDCFQPIQTEPGISDHFKVIGDADARPCVQRSVRRKVYRWHKLDETGLKHDLDQFRAKFEQSYRNKSVDENWQNFVDAVKDAVDKHVPSSMKSSRSNLPWLTRPLIRLIRRKNRAFYAAKSSGTVYHWARYRALRKQVQRDLRKAEQDFLSSTVFESLQTNVKKFWSFIKQRRRDTAGIAALWNDGTLVSSPSDKAETLSKQYESIFTREDTTSIPSLGPSPFPALHNLQIGTNGIVKLLQELNVNKAPGPDGINPHVLKICAKEIAPILQIIFTQSITSSKLPSDWRRANISALYKKGSRTDAANYRPVSLTSIACKILEHIIYHHVMNHLEEHNILNDVQHGFRARRSCETQLLSTMHNIIDAADTVKQVDAVVLDFAKAFDTVPHKRLLYKL
jgi:hypothetical protein